MPNKLKPLYELDEKMRNLMIQIEYDHRGQMELSEAGTFGKLYIFDRGPHTFPRKSIAKCPNFKKYGTPREAREAIEKLLHELEKTNVLRGNPWTNNFFDVTIFMGWPFLWSRLRDGTLKDLIKDPPGTWTTEAKLISLYLVARCLRMAKELGVEAHQDLKPENLFIDDIFKQLPEEKRSDLLGLTYNIRVGDFGLCDAFREFGQNAGSRPYMAPEQYQREPMKPTEGGKIDVFALGVIAHECLLSGMHPIGEITSEIWPWSEGVPKKWKHENVWKNWARSKKVLESAKALPKPIFSLLEWSLQAISADRASIRDMEEGFLAALRADGHDHVELLLEQIEDQEAQNSSTDWPHMNECLRKLRVFYSTT